MKYKIGDRIYLHVLPDMRKIVATIINTNMTPHGLVYECRTDYGNGMKLLEEEIEGIVDES